MTFFHGLPSTMPEVLHTSKYRPWRVRTYVAFTKEKLAIAFEKYLKSGSGRAFAKKHF